MTARHYRVEQLSRFVERVFARCGVPEADAHTAGEVLLSADLRGIDSHGIARLRTYYEMLSTRETNPDPKIRILRESGSTATLDGDNGLGLVVGPRANQLAMEKAARAGTGWVAVNNSNHYGIAGYYAMQAVQKDMIGWSMTNATASVAPLWGMEMMLGTNPLAIAFPGQEEPPIVIDLATSVVTMGAMDLAIARGGSIPAGWAIDAE